MDLTTLERLPLWIGGKAVAGQTTRFGEVANPAKGEVRLQRKRDLAAEDAARVTLGQLFH